MRNLRLTLVQFDTAWQDVAANLARVDGILRSLEGPTDCVILPEMFTTGFTMEARAHAERMDGKTVARLREWADFLGADVAGSLVILDGKRYYNRLVWVKPGGRIVAYDKRHLFRMAGEQKVYSAGGESVTVELHGWKVRPFICYDLRFPAWCRNREREFDAAVFVANWPEQRVEHWKTLLRARAIENQCYVIGVNRTGTDGNGVSHSGDSAVIGPAGGVLFEKGRGEYVGTVELSYDELAKYRDSFPAWKDADTFTLEK
ncbi:MAG: amidohydrolase [Spirochaetes bacterium]|nr:amidohydrolase [Spirochaetota bacterium]